MLGKVKLHYEKNIFLFTLNFFIFIFILLRIIFITLLERKILGFSQIRLGPNKLGFFGIFQPLFDGVKFLRKELLLIRVSNKKLFLLSPCIFILTIFLCWFCIIFFIISLISN